MTPLRTVLADLLHAQEQIQRLARLEIAWRPEHGWPPGAAIFVQYEHGLAVQAQELKRCYPILAANFPAANDEMPLPAA